MWQKNIFRLEKCLIIYYLNNLFFFYKFLVYDIFYTKNKKDIRIKSKFERTEIYSNKDHVFYQLLRIQTIFCGEKTANLSSVNIKETKENLMCYNKLFYKFCFMTNNYNCFQQNFKNRIIKGYCELIGNDHQCFLSRDVLSQRNFYAIKFQCKNESNYTSLYFVFFVYYQIDKLA